MSESWYYATGQERNGPVEDGEMASLAASGTVSPSTLVWRPGMQDWQIAERALPDALRPAGWPPAPAPDLAAAPPVAAGGAGGSAGGGAYAGGGAHAGATPHPTGFQESVRTAFSRYAVFSGRSRRPEYWWFTLFNLIVSLVASLLDAILFGGDVSILNGLYSLAVLIPSLAVGVRRLHDIGRTGWWLLIALVPIVGLIVLIVFFATKGEEQDNQYGPA